MRFFVLLWNPRKFENYPNLVEEFRLNGWVELSWSCGVRRDVAPDDGVILRRTGAGARGIVGFGRVRRGTYQANWNDDDSEDVGNFVDVDWEVLSVEPIISKDDSRFATVDRLWTAMAGGVQVDNAAGVRIAEVLRDSLTTAPTISRLLVREGERTLKTTKVRGRDGSVRQHCIEHHKCICAVCGFDPAQELGPEFSGLMDVHHLYPLAELYEGRDTDPVNDCVPLCPLCHRLAHHGMKLGTCRSIADLKRYRRAVR